MARDRKKYKIQICWKLKDDDKAWYGFLTIGSIFLVAIPPGVGKGWGKGGGVGLLSEKVRDARCLV